MFSSQQSIFQQERLFNEYISTVMHIGGNCLWIYILRCCYDFSEMFTKKWQDDSFKNGSSYEYPRKLLLKIYFDVPLWLQRNFHRKVTRWWLQNTPVHMWVLNNLNCFFCDASSQMLLHFFDSFHIGSLSSLVPSSLLSTLDKSFYVEIELSLSGTITAQLHTCNHRRAVPGWQRSSSASWQITPDPCGAGVCAEFTWKGMIFLEIQQHLLPLLEV